MISILSGLITSKTRIKILIRLFLNPKGTASLGLNSTVVRDVVKEPDSADVTLGTAFILQLIGGALAFALAVIAINAIRPDDDPAMDATDYPSRALSWYALEFLSRILSLYPEEGDTCVHIG